MNMPARHIRAETVSLDLTCRSPGPSLAKKCFCQFSHISIFKWAGMDSNLRCFPRNGFTVRPLRPLELPTHNVLYFWAKSIDLQKPLYRTCVSLFYGLILSSTGYFILEKKLRTFQIHSFSFCFRIIDSLFIIIFCLIKICPFFQRDRHKPSGSILSMKHRRNCSFRMISFRLFHCRIDIQLLNTFDFHMISGVSRDGSQWLLFLFLI